MQDYSLVVILLNLLMVFGGKFLIDYLVPAYSLLQLGVREPFFSII